MEQGVWGVSHAIAVASFANSPCTSIAYLTAHAGGRATHVARHMCGRGLAFRLLLVVGHTSCVVLYTSLFTIEMVAQFV